MIEIGTRTRQNFLYSRADQGQISRTFTRDKGLSKQSQGGSPTFSAGSSNISGANGTFPGFVVNDVIEVTGTNLNNGFFTVTAIDAVNHASLTLSPPPKDEAAPASYYIRSA